MMMYVLEAQLFATRGRWQRAQAFNGIFRHIGYMDEVFSSFDNACAYYDEHNSHMRKINAHLNGKSDWNPDSRLRYVVREYDGETRDIPPFGDLSHQTFIVNMKNKNRGAFLPDDEMYQLKDDYGELVPRRIEDGREFWSIIEALENDASGFIHNKNYLVEAFKDNDLYGLYVTETDHMFRRGAGEDPIFCRYTNYLLPCMCVKHGDAIEIIWTHSCLRRKGLARALVQRLGVTRADNPLPESLPFWGACGISTPSG